MRRRNHPKPHDASVAGAMRREPPSIICCCAVNRSGFAGTIRVSSVAFRRAAGKGTSDIVLATRVRPSFANAIHVCVALTTISSDGPAVAPGRVTIALSKQ
jgi:hypothetical protein